MENLFNELVTTCVGLGLLGGSYIVWFLTGVANNLFSDKKWSWKRMFEDIAKALLWCIAILAWVILCDGLEWFAHLCNCDISALMDGASVAGVLGGLIGGTIFYTTKAYKNILAFIDTNHVGAIVDNPDYEAIAETVAKYTTPKAVERQKEMEEKHDKDGGLGYSYVVPIESYQVFRDTVIGNGYDLDGHYSYQCWDGACLLWQQIGRWLYTGNGCASGCWTLERDVNAGDDFDLIYDKKQIKRGDVVVFSCGQYGHIGYADEDYNGSDYIRLLGQNQSADMKFCVINMGLGTFLGAFRFKQWAKKPTPTPPAPTPSKFQVGDIVVPKRLVDYYGTPLIQWDDNYVITQISGDRAVLCANRGGDLICWAAMNTKDIKKV